jgi:hypothetical protein
VIQSSKALSGCPLPAAWEFAEFEADLLKVCTAPANTPTPSFTGLFEPTPQRCTAHRTSADCDRSGDFRHA